MAVKVGLVAALLGVLWALLATAAHLAMFRGYLPGPAESGPLVAAALYLVRGPFVAAILFSTAIGRSSPSLMELVLEAIVIGSAAGLLIGGALVSVRRTT